MELLDSPRRPPEDFLLLLVMVLTGIFLAMAVLQAAFPHAFAAFWDALVRAWGDIQAFAWSYFLLSSIFYRTAGPALKGKKRGDRMENLKTRAFGKFVSLIPEGIKARLIAIEKKIKEVIEE